MQKLLFCLALLFFPLVAQAQESKAPYAQLASRVDQLVQMDSINTGVVVAIDTVSAIDGLNFDKNTNEIEVQQEGVYFIMAVAQVGAREYVRDIVKGGDMYFWIECNQQPVADSGSWIFVSPTARSHTIVDQIIQPCKKGDRIRFKFSASAPSLGLITFNATEKWPRAPGITVSMYKIN